MFWRRLPRPWALAVDWLLTIGVAILFVLVFEAEVAKPYRIPSASMEPTLHCARPEAYCRARVSDRIVANRLAFRFRRPHRGEVVVFHTPPEALAACGRSGVFVKRVIGLPGETVSEVSGRVLVDGRPLKEPYVDPRDRDSTTQVFPRVPAGSYFLLGDNRDHSCDSRSWGPVPRRNLIGPVLLRYWPVWRIFD